MSTYFQILNPRRPAIACLDALVHTASPCDQRLVLRAANTPVNRKALREAVRLPSVLILVALPDGETYTLRGFFRHVAVLADVLEAQFLPTGPVAHKPADAPPT